MMDRRTEIIAQLLHELRLEDHLTSPAQTSNMLTDTFAEVFGGIHQDDTLPDQLITLHSISFQSMCEHHFLPFFGYVDVCYLPDKQFVGTGQLTQLVKLLVRRPQLQEHFTSQIADTIERGLQPAGLGVHVVGRHFYEAMRGTRETAQTFETLEFRGSLGADHRQVFLSGLTREVNL